MQPDTAPAVTRVVEDYLTLIWKAHEWPDGQPTTSDLAAQLGVTASTVSANLKKLARDGFIDYVPYGHIKLNPSGRAIAVAIVRRHRLLETYLVRHLGLAWDQVHDEADRLEHAVSELVLARIDSVLGHPTEDPHGAPIPDAQGCIAQDHSARLDDILPGETIEVRRVSDRSPDVLRFLKNRGVVLGALLKVRDKSAPASSICVEINGEPVELSLHTAAAVRVTRVRR